MPVDAQTQNTLHQALIRMGLISTADCLNVAPMTGGISCDVFRVDLPTGPICMKRPLPKLKARKDWYAPVERSEYEVAWIEEVAKILPGAVPQILGEDRDTGLFAMDYLPPEIYPVWKHQLRDGVIDTRVAEQLGDMIGQIHSATADRQDLAERFAEAARFFHALRIDAYFLDTGREHPDCQDRIEALANRTEATHLTLVHGDFSPKNILAGPDGPVLLDAETGHNGDPAFDLAFCLNHLLLKCIWRPIWTDQYLACFSSLSGAYLARVNWEPVEDIEARIASLLPVMLLARIDGKSPVEYITKDVERDFVRGFAKPLIHAPPATLSEVSVLWQRARA